MRQLTWILLLAGCGSTTNAAPPAPVILTGIYAGSYTTNTAPGQGFNATIVMTEARDSTLTGTMSLPSGTLPLPFTGTFARDTVTLLVTLTLPYVGGGTAKFAATEAGAHLVGTFVGAPGTFAGQTFDIDVRRQ